MYVYIYIFAYTIVIDTLDYSYAYVSYVEVPPYLSRRQAAHVIRVEGRAHAVTGLPQCVLSQVYIRIIDVLIYTLVYIYIYY